MAGQQRVYRERIGSTKALQKIFRAMELIATSRIAKARDAAQLAAPFIRALTRAVSAVASHVGTEFEHPLVTERTDTNRVLVLVMTADRGMAGAYNASVLREADRLRERLEAEGHTIDLCCTGRRGIGHYQYRGVPLVATWEGWSDAPERPHSREIANTLLRRFLAEAEPKDGSEPGVREIHIVYTRFRSMVVQEPRVIRMLPLEIVEQDASESEELFPLYEFEPSPAEVLDALLPRYIRSRVWNCLLQAAASELAARQSAMHTATENAEDLIRQYTRLANEARQAEITQEISEIVSGVNALASGG